MRRRIHALTAATAAAALFMISTAAVAGTAGRWLHVRVDGGDADERVSVNVPLEMVEAMLPLIQTDQMRNGRIRIDAEDTNLHGIDLKRLVQAVRDAPDTEFVTVRSNDENVRVVKEAGFIRVEVDSRNDSEKVRVRVPMTVVDALIGDDPHELDLIGALRALADFQGEDIVTIESDDETVRIWIDGNQTGD